ncbi:aldehyde dehydrogenase (NADP(+)) [Rheinheimera texasensis]|uniref:aldehyde dehydrogenase (NADP(+)) n=1 Tax=Rheinheimera texasensis TaxID=306205 RepID=UPI0032B280C3
MSDHALFQLQDSNTPFAGRHLIHGVWQGEATAAFHSYMPAENRALPWTFPEAGPAELQALMQSAQAAFAEYRQCSRAVRAAFLRQIAVEIEALGSVLVETVMAETALPQARVEGERGRTCNQLRLFAGLLDEPAASTYLPAQPQRVPLPAPELRLESVPLGPVLVFAASNFPLAFSVAGGDTASALAAGCPVIVKAHNAHPATSALVAQAIDKARLTCGLPAGVFQLVYAQRHDFSAQLLQHPVVKAVAFTGSEQLGLHFQKLIQQRSVPVPFYGELGSQNPLLLLPEQLALHGTAFATALAQSVLQGNGQFCTRPGLVFIPDQPETGAMLDTLAGSFTATSLVTLLTAKIAEGYRHSCAVLNGLPGVTQLAEGRSALVEKGCQVLPRLFITDAARWHEVPQLQHEVFGPATVLIRYRMLAELEAILPTLKGQLTCTVYGTDKDLQALQPLLPLLADCCGRLIRNQMPTGVEVCSAMQHGGPFPASTDLRFTAVGTAAYQRFVRPLCWQNFGQ